MTETVWTIMARGLNLTKMAPSLENMATRRRMLRTKRMTQLWRHSFECCVSLALRVEYWPVVTHALGFHRVKNPA